MLDAKSVLVWPGIFEREVEGALRLEPRIDPCGVVRIVLRMDQSIAGTARRQTVDGAPIATDYACIDDGSGGIGVEEDVVERRIVLDVEAAPDDHSLASFAVINK